MPRKRTFLDEAYTQPYNSVAPIRTYQGEIKADNRSAWRRFQDNLVKSISESKNPLVNLGKIGAKTALGATMLINPMETLAFLAGSGLTRKAADTAAERLTGRNTTQLLSDSRADLNPQIAELVNPVNFAGGLSGISLLNQLRNTEANAAANYLRSRFNGPRVTIDAQGNVLGPTVNNLPSTARITPRNTNTQTGITPTRRQSVRTQPRLAGRRTPQLVDMTARPNLENDPQWRAAVLEGQNSVSDSPVFRALSENNATYDADMRAEMLADLDIMTRDGRISPDADDYTYIRDVANGTFPNPGTLETFDAARLLDRYAAAPNGGFFRRFNSLRSRDNALPYAYRQPNLDFDFASTMQDLDNIERRVAESETRAIENARTNLLNRYNEFVANNGELPNFRNDVTNATTLPDLGDLASFLDDRIEENIPATTSEEESTINNFFNIYGNSTPSDFGHDSTYTPDLESLPFDIPTERAAGDYQPWYTDPAQLLRERLLDDYGYIPSLRNRINDADGYIELRDIQFNMERVNNNQIDIRDVYPDAANEYVRLGRTPDVSSDYDIDSQSSPVDFETVRRVRSNLMNDADRAMLNSQQTIYSNDPTLGNTLPPEYQQYIGNQLRGDKPYYFNEGDIAVNALIDEWGKTGKVNQEKYNKLSRAGQREFDWFINRSPNTSSSVYTEPKVTVKGRSVKYQSSGNHATGTIKNGRKDIYSASFFNPGKGATDLMAFIDRDLTKDDIISIAVGDGHLSQNSNSLLTSWLAKRNSEKSHPGYRIEPEGTSRLNPFGRISIRGIQRDPNTPLDRVRHVDELRRRYQLLQDVYNKRFPDNPLNFDVNNSIYYDGYRYIVPGYRAIHLKRGGKINLRNSCR